MTTSIRRVALLLMLLFVGVTLALPYWQFVMAPELLVRADNARPLEEERRIQRGRILSADGQELAVSRREPPASARAPTPTTPWPPPSATGAPPAAPAAWSWRGTWTCAARAA